MTTKIFYFSGTGNSLKIARDIAKGIDDAEIVSIADFMRNKSKVIADTMGIVVPVYCWGLPVIVVDFIKELQKDSAKYVFGIVNYGGFPAGTLPQMDKLLKQQGLKLNASFGIMMPGNYTPMYGAKSQEKQQKMFKKEKEKVSEIINIIKNKKITKIAKNNFVVNFIFTKLFYNASIGQMKSQDKSFWVDNKCDGCEICAKVCPVDNITIEKGKPTWHNKCEQCLACLQWCPKEAIQFGKSTANRKRYRHPEATVKDFLKK